MQTMGRIYIKRRGILKDGSATIVDLHDVGYVSVKTRKERMQYLVNKYSVDNTRIFISVIPIIN